METAEIIRWNGSSSRIAKRKIIYFSMDRLIRALEATASLIVRFRQQQLQLIGRFQYGQFF